MKLLDEVLSEIKPSKEKEKEVMSKVKDILKKLDRIKDTKVVLGGSGIKGTWLKNANDADIFVCFNYNKYKEKSDELSGILGGKLKKLFSGVIRLHGSRDYFQIKTKHFTYEIVPILDIKDASSAKNITDVSPLHTKYVLKKTDNKLRDEIRLTKKFCKAAKVYGAESYIRGVSGYMCEILTIYYGSFLKLARNAAKWKEKEIIDAEKHWKGKDILHELNASKTISPLILIDPVQADRNAAAALSSEKFEKFIKACKDFTKKPSKRFFEEKALSVEDLAKKNKGVIILDIVPLKKKEDVAGAKFVKAMEIIKNELEKKGFKVHDSGWEWNDNTFIYFLVDKKALDRYEVREGPFVRAKFHVTRFKKAHKNTFVKGKRIYAKVMREYTKPEELVSDIIKKDFIKEKVLKIKCKRLS